MAIIGQRAEGLGDGSEPPSRGGVRSEDGTRSSSHYTQDIPLTSWNREDSTDDEDLSVKQIDQESSRTSTRDQELLVVRKLDRRLVLFVALLYMFSFLDRSNIGNAKAAGLETDLNLSEAQFRWTLDGFYITYILFEFMTICYRVFPAHAYVSICVAGMGTIAALQAVATGFWSMFVLRLCLGLAEASFGPGIPFYLSMFFKRDELARRTGLFIAAAPLANSFSGTLAWLILRFSTQSGIDGWRLLFLAEGFPNIILAVLAWYIVPDSPQNVPWLSHKERRIAALRLRQGHSRKSSAGQSSEKKVDWSRIWTTLLDPKSYIVAAILFSLNVSFSSLPVFLPTIVKDMGYSALSAQGMSAFPNLSAFAVVLLSASLSDRFQSRSVPLITHAVLAMSGYALLAAAPRMPHLLRYLCLFPITAGFFSAVTMVIVWTVNNQEHDEGKAIGSSILQVFGHVGSLVGQQLYPQSGAPYYVRSHASCAFFLAIAAVLAFMLRILLKTANKSRSRSRKNSEVVDETNVPFVSEANVIDFTYML